MIKLTYFDTSILRILIDNPIAWVNFKHWSIKELGLTPKPIGSVYLFFEYLGFEKMRFEIPDSLHKPNLGHLKFPKERQEAQKARERKLPAFKEEIIKLHEALQDHIANKIEFNKNIITDLKNARFVEKNKSRMAWNETFTAIRAFRDNSNIFLQQDSLEDSLFDEYNSLLENNFTEFVKYASSLLAWDELCSIIPGGISQDDVREILFGIWRCHYEEHSHTLTLGKPAIGLSHYYKLDDKPKNYLMKNYEDMVDSEMYTLLILGHKTDDEIKAVNVITLETPDVATARMKIVSGNIVNMEDVLNIYLPKFTGKVYCVDKNLNLVKVLEPQIPIRL